MTSDQEKQLDDLNKQIQEMKSDRIKFDKELEKYNYNPNYKAKKMEEKKSEIEKLKLEEKRMFDLHREYWNKPNLSQCELGLFQRNATELKNIRVKISEEEKKLNG
ncbi:MAG: hypothetical protein IPH62_15090 [Ignavibacteriae bacterium]|nr:hypothetical protein [Ignavibacteriota bacterium]